MAFVKGRKIRDNILLCQELIHNYHRSTSSPKRYALKIDILKAYDPVNWKFLLKVLRGLRFLQIFIHWIECVFLPQNTLFQEAFNKKTLFPRTYLLLAWMFSQDYLTRLLRIQISNSIRCVRKIGSLTFVSCMTSWCFTTQM